MQLLPIAHRRHHDLKLGMLDRLVDRWLLLARLWLWLTLSGLGSWGLLLDRGRGLIARWTLASGAWRGRIDATADRLRDWLDRTLDESSISGASGTERVPKLLQVRAREFARLLDRRFLGSGCTRARHGHVADVGVFAGGLKWAGH
ncbi:MAG: hypothetical protein ACRDQZ_13115 [Mycobacteriales bacterium]